jgi:hypothetical protein
MNRRVSGETLSNSLACFVSLLFCYNAVKLGFSKGWGSDAHIYRDFSLPAGFAAVLWLAGATWLGWRTAQQYLISFEKAGLRIPRLGGTVFVPWSGIRRVNIVKDGVGYRLRLVSATTNVSLRLSVYSDPSALVRLIERSTPQVDHTSIASFLNGLL